MEPKPSIFLKFLAMTLCVLVFSECVVSVIPIKNVVILVMENRSFDHMLGWMKRNNPQINGVTGRESNPESTGDANSAPVYFKDGAEYVDPDPGHSFGAIRDQIFGPGRTSSNGPPPMNGFAEQAIKQGGTDLRDAVMNGFRPEAVPVYADLVREFAVFDNWFASVPASTQPNRLYVHSATSHGATGNVASLLAAGYPQETIFDRIHQAGLDFGIYYQNIPATLFYRNLRKLKYISKFHNYKPTFGKHARDGKLPDYSVVEQRYMDSKSNPANDDHPSHDVGQGQRFVKEVYETLRSSPQWNTTLLLITYDEHGGFFDHVPTPVSGVPSPDGVVGPVPYNFTFDRLGVRVPTIAVSPWIEKGTVVHAPNGPQPSSQYEHSSIPATMKKIFNLQSDFLTKRDAWAATFEGVLSRSTPRTDCPVKLSEPVMLRKTEANEEAGLSSFQGELVQLASSLNGYYTLKSYDGEEIGKNMTVREANEYVENSLKGFIEAGKQALTMGAHEEEIVKMRPSLTSRSPVP